jgi:hypothetical protein
MVMSMGARPGSMPARRARVRAKGDWISRPRSASELDPSCMGAMDRPAGLTQMVAEHIGPGRKRPVGGPSSAIRNGELVALSCKLCDLQSGIVLRVQDRIRGVKGIVFTEFLEMVEARYSGRLVEDVIEEADIPSKGAYTAVGTYPHDEMVALVTVLSKRTGVPVPDLLKLYGEHLFGRFEVKYPQFFDEAKCSFDFLNAVQNHIHKEVKKLYADAELPSFILEVHTQDHFSMVYSSTRPLADLCEGLIVGCMKYFRETGEIRRQDLQSSPLTRVRFEIFKSAA